MKKYFTFANGLAVFTLAILAFAAASYTSPKTRYDIPVTIENEDGVQALNFFTGGNYQTTYKMDTLSAAGTTYKELPYNMASPFQYQYYIKLRKITGTPNTKIRLEEKTVASSSIWRPLDSVSCAGVDSLKYHFLLRGQVAYGAKHRLAFVKTGTNKLERNIEVNIKATNVPQ